MMGKIIIPIVIAVLAVAIGVTLFFYSDGNNENSINENSDPLSHYSKFGPFYIEKLEYTLGESVFFVVRGLEPHQSGTIIFITPKNVIFNTVTFDGAKKSNFNSYFKPDTLKPLNICEPEDIVGNWTVVFEGIALQPVRFEMLNEYLVGGEADIVKVC